MVGKYLRYLPRPLLTDLVEQRWLPIVGAGFSRNAVVPKGCRMPLWAELGRAIAEEMPDFPCSDPLDAMSAYAHQFSRARLTERLMRLLLVGEAQPGAAHRAFCSMPFDIVCTTNFEFLLEDGYHAVGRYCQPIIDEDQLSVSTKDTAVTLLKFHGDLHHPERLVVTEEDYDRFLNAYPLLATYLASLLITRTAILVGYRADDPDFRQLWQLIGGRLGRLRRTAYTIVVAAQKTEVMRFERRGVKVIALPGAQARYDEILAGLFKELRLYQAENLVPASQVTEEEPLAELLLPRDAANRLCFIAVPSAALPFYKDRVFAVVRQRGFVPVTADDVLAPGDSLAAKVQALIERAELVIVDASRPSTRYEMELAFRRLRPERILVVLQEHLVPSFEAAEVPVIRRPTLPIQEPEVFLRSIDEWLSQRAEAVAPKLASEPERLLRLREFRAAVVAAMTLLEARLRKNLERAQVDVGPTKGMGWLVESARRSAILSPNEANQLVEWQRLRNMLVHSAQEVPARTARQAVTGILRIVKRLKESP